MKSVTGWSIAALFLLAMAVPARAQSVPDCEPVRCAFQAAIDEACQCDLATNHGQHVKCVAHVVRDLARTDQIPTNCKGKIKRCAARSICGKPGFVTCNVPVYGTCDLNTNTCENDPLVLCAANTDCLLGTRCKTKSSAERCAEAGGTVGSSTTCCSNCVAP